MPASDPIPPRPLRALWSTLLALLCVACQAQEPEGATATHPLAPEAGRYYHGVYPGDTDGMEHDVEPAHLDAYEAAVGREAAWVVFSNDWFASSAFPADTVAWIAERGAIPYVRLMLRSGSELAERETVYSLSNILAGEFDEELRAWGEGARAFGGPLIVEWGTEANGSWFPWNGYWNGRGDEGPAKFRDAYRHIVETIAAPNVVWVFHVNAYDDPREPWNRLENYYPGDDVVDWLGVSVYGSQSPEGGEARSFVRTMNDVVPRLRELAPRKPIVVSEFGTIRGGSVDAAAWAGEALDALLSGTWPAVRGFSWWNEGWPLDGRGSVTMRVQDDEALARAFRERLDAAADVLAAPRSEPAPAEE